MVIPGRALLLLVGLVISIFLALVLSGQALTTVDDDDLLRHLSQTLDGLNGAKELLLDYHARHGRYPSNDEGLVVLDGFESRFPVTLWLPHHPPDELPSVFGFRYDEDELHNLVRAFRWKKGRLPQSSHELVGETGYFREEQYEAVPVEVAIRGDDRIFIFSTGGLLTPLYVPYMYENRRGIDAARFAHSPVNDDDEGRYSVRVDDGIYVYAVDGLYHAERLDEARRNRAIAGAGAIVALLAFVTMLVLLIRMKAWVVGLIGILGIVGIGGLQLLNTPTCYVRWAPFRSRNPEIVVQQRQLLEKQRAAGVISQQTYERVVESLKDAS